MSAREIVASLRGQWCGSYGMVRCPVHEDRTPSLSISDGEDGRLLVHCHAGCNGTDVLRALRSRGLADSTDEAPEPAPKRNNNGAFALELWRESRPAAGTLVEDYLRSRGITLPVPPSIRYHPGLTHAPTRLDLPAMVAAVQAPDRKIIAVHRTFLSLLGRKASVSSPKMALGTLGAGAVRLAPAVSVLGLAEGLEDALAAMQLFRIPVWAVLGGNRLGRVEIPSEVREVRIFADGDEAGREAAIKAVREFRRKGLTARAFLPPGGAKDFNEALIAEAEQCGQ